MTRDDQLRLKSTTKTKRGKKNEKPAKKKGKRGKKSGGKKSDVKKPKVSRKRSVLRMKNSNSPKTQTQTPGEGDTAEVEPPQKKTKEDPNWQFHWQTEAQDCGDREAPNNKGESQG